MVQVELQGKFPKGVDDRFVGMLARAAFKRGGGRGKFAVTVAAVADAKMRALNKKYRGKDKTTDVLSFAYEDETGKGILSGGDIVISLPQVRRQAKAIGRDVKDELALMVVHGMLHLLGYDHADVKEETVMFGLQQDILHLTRVL